MGAPVDRKREADLLKPYIVEWLRDMTGRAATGGGNSTVGVVTPPPSPSISSHVLATATGLGQYHTVSGLTTGQVLRALTDTTAAFGQLQHSQLGGIGPNDHHNQLHVLATTTALGGDHTIAGASVGQVLRALGTDTARFERLFYSDLQGTGSLYDVVAWSAADTITKLTPSADVTLGETALLRSNAGNLSLKTIIATVLVQTEHITSPADLLLDPVGDIYLSPSGSDVKISGTASFISTNFLEGFPKAGFRMGPTLLAGQTALSIGLIDADELRVRIFVADETRVDRGQLYITKSYGILSEPFTCPTLVGNSADIYFENSPNLGTDGALFTDGDWILLRYLDIDTGIDLLNCWGQVTATLGVPVFSNRMEEGDLPGFPTGIRQQKWTFTFRQGTGGLLFNRASMGIDFGADGQGYLLLSAVGPNAPFMQAGRWTTNPYEPANRAVFAQMGALAGVGFTNEYGFAAGLNLGDPTQPYVLMSNLNQKMYKVDSSWHDGTYKTAWIEANGRARFGTNVVNAATTFLDINPATGVATFRGTIEILAGTIPVGDISGLGALATKNAVNLATTEVTNKSLLNLDSTANTKLGGIAAGATVGATWGTGGNITSFPGFLGTPSAAGLYMTSTGMGYWNGSAWKVAITSGGAFYFGSAANSSIRWDGTDLKGVDSLGATQWYARSTDGKLYAGGGIARMDSNGFTVKGSANNTIGRVNQYALETSSGSFAGGLSHRTYNAVGMMRAGLGDGADANDPYIEFLESTVTRSVTISATGASIFIRDSLVDVIGAFSVTGTGTFSSTVTTTFLNSTGSVYANGGMVIVNNYSPGYGVSINANTAGGWARGYSFRNDSNVLIGQFGAYGAGSDNLSFMYIGLYGDYVATFNPSTKVIQGHGDWGTTGAINAGGQFKRDNVAGCIYVPLATTVMTDTLGNVWTSAARAVGTYTFDVNAAANGSVPAGVKAVAVMGTFVWAAAANGSYATLQYPSGANEIVARAQSGGIGCDISGTVKVDTNGQFTVIIAGVATTVTLLRIVGYYI